jgi:hypothetical protein
MYDEGTVDEDVHERIEQLHEYLAATAERPVDTRASQWLGEAEAAAGDAVDPDIPEAAAKKRVHQVVALLAQVDETGDEEADELVAEAHELAKDLDRELGDTGVM